MGHDCVVGLGRGSLGLSLADTLMPWCGPDEAGRLLCPLTGAVYSRGSGRSARVKARGRTRARNWTPGGAREGPVDAQVGR